MRCDNCGDDINLENYDGHCPNCNRYLCPDCADWDNFDGETICDSCWGKIEFTFPATTNKKQTEETNG